MKNLQAPLRWTMEVAEWKFTVEFQELSIPHLVEQAPSFHHLRPVYFCLCTSATFLRNGQLRPAVPSHFPSSAQQHASPALHQHTLCAPQVHFLLLDQLDIPVPASEHAQRHIAATATVSMASTGVATAKRTMQATIVPDSWQWNMGAPHSQGVLRDPPVHAVSGCLKFGSNVFLQGS